MVIIFFSEFMVASKSISEPLELVSLSVMRLSTFESVSVELSVFCIAVLNVKIRFELEVKSAEESVGLNVNVGERVVAIEPLPTVEVPEIFIAKQLVYQVPEDVISKSLSIAMAFVDCAAEVPANVTS